MSESRTTDTAWGTAVRKHQSEAIVGAETTETGSAKGRLVASGAVGQGHLPDQGTLRAACRVASSSAMGSASVSAA